MATLTPGFQPVPEFIQDANEHRRKIARAVNLLLMAKFNAFVDATLAANAATTKVTDARISYYSTILWMPMTAHSSAEIAAGTMYITQANLTTGFFTVNHANNAQTDRIFRFIILG